MHIDSALINDDRLQVDQTTTATAQANTAAGAVNTDNTGLQTDDANWHPIVRVVSRRRTSTGVWLYRVEWDGPQPTFSELYARDNSDGALAEFKKRITRKRAY